MRGEEILDDGAGEGWNRDSIEKEGQFLSFRSLPFRSWPLPTETPNSLASKQSFPLA